MLNKDYQELVSELADNSEAFNAALEKVGIAQSITNALKSICGTREKDLTLRNAVDEAARIRYEEKHQLKHVIMPNGEQLGTYTVVLTKGADEKVVDDMSVSNEEAFVQYVLNDSEMLEQLIRKNIQALVDTYFKEGVVPAGCDCGKRVIPAEPCVYKNGMLKVDTSKLPKLQNALPNLLGGGE